MAIDWKCPLCKKRAARTKAKKTLARINGEWMEVLACGACYLAGTSAPPLDQRGGLTSAQRSKKV